MSLRFAFLLILVSGLSGCFLDRSGTAVREGGPRRLDSGTADAGPGGVDAGPDTPDAGGCPAGTVDLDRDPANGCECVVSTEVCDGVLDEDCDGSVDEGCDCTPGAIDNCGVDVGACTFGTQTCLPGGVWSGCEGGTRPTEETCNDVDDDCDGVVDEDITRTCSTNVGVCVEGTETCVAGGWGACTGTLAGVEVCDGAMLDEDCDGMVNEGCECVDTETGSCMVLTCAGTWTCSSGVRGACTIVSPVPETCNGIDDDCNGSIDDGAGVCTSSGCTRITNGSGTYLLCSGTRRTWAAALLHCAAYGYHLATVDDAAEDEALSMAADAQRSDDWWIGTADVDNDGVFTWQVPPSGTYSNWNNQDRGECGAIDSADRHWDSQTCNSARPFICEAPAP